MLAVVAVVALLALLVWYQSTSVSAPQRRRLDGRWGQMAPELPLPRGPIDADARFEPVPTSRIAVPAVFAIVLAAGGVVAFVLGAEPLGVVALVVAACEAGAALSARRQNKRAVAFAVERLLEPRPTGSNGPDGPT